MCQAEAASGTSPSKTLGTEPLSFPSRQHFSRAVLSHVIAAAVKCVLKFVPGFLLDFALFHFAMINHK